MAAESGQVDRLLQDLAEEYEKSRALLAHLEDSLKYRSDSQPASGAPERGGTDALPRVAEERSLEQRDETEEEETKPPQKALPNAQQRAPSFRSKLAGFFSRNRAQSSRVLTATESADLNEPEPVRRISVVNLNGVFDNNLSSAGQGDGPRRSVSLHPTGCNGGAPLQPTSALNRLAPRASLEIRQQQFFFEETPTPQRFSSSNLGAFGPSSGPRRRSLEHPGAGGAVGGGGSGPRRTSIEGNAATAMRGRPPSLHSYDSNGNNGSGGMGMRGSPRQSQLGVTPPTDAVTPLAADAGVDVPSPGAQSDAGAVPHATLLPGRSDSARRLSMTRRGSDNASGLYRTLSLNTANHSHHHSHHQHHHHHLQQQLESPLGSPSGPSCLSLGAALPSLLPVGGGSSGGGSPGMVRRDSSSSLGHNLPLRVNSITSPLSVVQMAADDVVPAGPGEHCISAPGMLPPNCAGGGSPQPPQSQMPRLQPLRVRSVHHALSPSGLGLVAGGRQLQSFRQADGLESGPGGGAGGGGPLGCQEDDGSGRRQSTAQYGSPRVSGGGAVATSGNNSFRGTMHLI